MRYKEPGGLKANGTQDGFGWLQSDEGYITLKCLMILVAANNHGCYLTCLLVYVSCVWECVVAAACFVVSRGGRHRSMFQLLIQCLQAPHALCKSFQ